MLGPFLPFLAVLLAAAVAHAEPPPPSQALPSDPRPHGPSVGVGIDGAAMLLGDFAARVDVALAPVVSLGLAAGVARRAGTDDLLVEVGLSFWPLAGALGEGLEGLTLELVTGCAWSGPWTGQEGAAVRLGGELGWQLLWGPVALTLGGGAHATLGRGTPRLEPRITGALGLVW
ncbi:MAG: hypothetical protein OHK0013_26290 [Sandaracinaceae bacterium]